jgi:two-component system nitrogen regulation sensor histidine kinase GlnL
MSVFPLRRRARAGGGPLDIVAALPIPVVVLDADGAVVVANAAAETFFNLSQASLCERGLTAGLAPGAALMTLILAARAASKDFIAYDHEIALVGGRTARADVFVTPLADASAGTLVSLQPRAVAAMVDRQLAGQGAARSAIGVAAMLAHEIKNPLSGIRGAAQLLAATADPDARELTTLIQQEVDRVAALIDRMEGFTDTRPMPMGPENIHAVLGHVRKVARSGFARGMTIRERYDPSLPPVSGNYDALVQVFLNLVKNAAEALADGDGDGEITLTTAYRHGFRVAAEGSTRRVALPIEVCVIDSGVGPLPDVARHMFEPFVSSKRRGGGLGLALVAKIVGDHGGIVEFDRLTNPPRTVFRVLLPTATSGVETVG